MESEGISMEPKMFEEMDSDELLSEAASFAPHGKDISVALSLIVIAKRLEEIVELLRER
jgi:hypothetical protein